MKRETERKKVIKRLRDIAFGRSNDAVKLVFLSEENASEMLNDLDLTMLSEVKRGQNGTVEMKLISRLEVLKLLLDELRPAEKNTSGTEGFFLALNNAAKGGESDNSEY